MNAAFASYQIYRMRLRSRQVVLILTGQGRSALQMFVWLSQSSQHQCLPFNARVIALARHRSRKINLRKPINRFTCSRKIACLVKEPKYMFHLRFVFTELQKISHTKQLCQEHQTTSMFVFAISVRDIVFPLLLAARVIVYLLSKASVNFGRK